MKIANLFLIVTLTSIQPVKAEDYYAFAPNHLGGWVMLTKNVCRYDKTLPEAFTTDYKGNRTFSCYWFGITKIIFKNEKGSISSMPKRDFETVHSVI